MNVLIDTNVYLNFFRRQKDQSLLLLDNLLSLQKEKKIKVLLPQQVEDEYWRNKRQVLESIVDEMQKGIQEDIVLPDIVKSYTASLQLKELKKKFCTLKKEIIEEYKQKSISIDSDINIKIGSIFSHAIRIQEEENILKKAYFRTLKGNPPKKGEKSFGDAIIWETLLAYRSKEELVIISNDGDFAESHDKDVISEFLEKEWKQTNHTKITLYTNLGLFINDQSEGQNPVNLDVIDTEKRINTSTLTSLPYLSMIHPFSTTGFVTYHCTCCGIFFQSTENYTSASVSFGKCPDCSASSISYGRKCVKCGQHYHISATSALPDNSQCYRCKEHA